MFFSCEIKSCIVRSFYFLFSFFVNWLQYLLWEIGVWHDNLTCNLSGFLGKCMIKWRKWNPIIECIVGLKGFRSFCWKSELGIWKVIAILIEKIYMSLSLIFAAVFQEISKKWQKNPNAKYLSHTLLKFFLSSITKLIRSYLTKLFQRFQSRICHFLENLKFLLLQLE